VVSGHENGFDQIASIIIENRRGQTDTYRTRRSMYLTLNFSPDERAEKRRPRMRNDHVRGWSTNSKMRVPAFLPLASESPTPRARGRMHLNPSLLFGDRDRDIKRLKDTRLEYYLLYLFTRLELRYSSKSRQPEFLFEYLAGNAIALCGNIENFAKDRANYIIVCMSLF